MNNHQAKYKQQSKPEDRRLLRVRNFELHRRDVKDHKWASQRGINCDTSTPKKEPNSRRKQLELWKRDKECRQKNTIKKPPFRVGVVHHRFYSPPVPINSKKNIPNNISQNITKISQLPKRVTRATEKRLMVKNTALSVKSKKSPKSFAAKNYQFVPPPIGSKVLKLELVKTPRIEHDWNFGMSFGLMKSPALDETFDKNSNDSQDSSWSLKVSLDEKDNDSNLLNVSTSPTTNIYSSPPTDSASSGSKKSTPLPPAFYSPYIVSSREKKNARKEQQSRKGLRSINPNEIPTKETLMQNLNISIENEERTAIFFKHLLHQEESRLTELCNNWTQIRSEETVPEDAGYLINQAIGQTQLLLGKKFQRFRGLIEHCENGKGQRLITCTDLQGFWDMTKPEIKNCDQRFEKLEELKVNNWEEPNEPDIEKSEEKKPVETRVVRKKKSKISANPSSLKSFILAAKEKMKNQESSDDSDISKSNKNQSKASKTRSPSKRTSLKPSKIPGEIISPQVGMKISRKYKTPEVQIDRSISYVNSHQTPGRGILKKNERSIKKSAPKVNFDEVSINPTNKTLMDQELAVVLNKIVETENHIPIKGKILEFDDDDTSEDMETNAKCNENVCINVIPPTPAQTNSTLETNAKCKENVHINVIPPTPAQTNSTLGEADTSIRVLRNRTINCLSTPSRRQSRTRHSFKEIGSQEAEIQTQVSETLESKENKTPNRKRRQSRISSII